MLNVLLIVSIVNLVAVLGLIWLIRELYQVILRLLEEE